MKRIASILILFAIAGNASAASVVQSKVCPYMGNGGGSTTTACSLNSAATIGNRIIAVVNNATLRSVVSGADSGSTSYSQAGTVAAGEPSIWHGPATSTSAGNNVVFTLSGNSGDETQIVLYEVSGLAASQAALTQSLNSSGPSMTFTSNSITPANATGFAVAVSIRGNRSYTEDPDWTQMSTGTAGSYIGYIINPPASSLNVSFASDANAFATINLAAFVGASTLYYGYTPTLYMAPTDQGTGDCSSEVNACDPAQAVAAAACGDIVGAIPGTYSFTPPSGGSITPMLSFTNSCSSGTPLIFTAKYDALHNESNSSLLSKLRSSAPDTSDFENNAPVFGIDTNYVKAIGFYVDQTLAPPKPSHGTVFLNDCTGCEIEAWVFDQMTFPNALDNYNSIFASLVTSPKIENNVFRGGTHSLNNHNVCAIATYATLNFTISNNTFSSVNCGIFIKGTGNGNTIGNSGTIEKNKSMNASHTFIDIAVVRGENEAVGNRVVVRENLSVNDGAIGGRAMGCDSSGEGCQYVDFYHNTAVNNATGVSMFWMRSGTMTDMTFRDNVARFTSTVGSESHPIRIDEVGASAFTTLDYNLYSEQGATALFAMLGSTYSGIAAWRTATGKEANSSEATPTFVNAGAGDYRLSGDTGSSTSGPRGITTAPADLGADGT